MSVRFQIVLVITHRLVAIEEAKTVLFGYLPVEADLISGLLNAPGIEKLHVGIGRHSETFLVVLHLQTAAKHALTLTIIGLRLAVVGIV